MLAAAPALHSQASPDAVRRFPNAELDGRRYRAGASARNLGAMKNDRLAQLDTAVDALFRRCPDLCGFAIHEMRTSPNREIVSEDIAVQPRAGHKASPDLLNQIAAALLEVVDERPEAAELLVGRTFAPVIH